MTHVAIVEDDPRIRASLANTVRDLEMIPLTYDSAEAAAIALRDEAEPPDLLLVDVRLPTMSGIDLVRQFAAADRLPPTIVISGEATITETVEGLRLGVYDFIEKPFSRERLMRAIRNALQHTSLRRELERLRGELDRQAPILGDSPEIEGLKKLVRQAAPTEASVLIVGESGTGKELVADSLHRQSCRAAQPFVKVNCAAIPHNLIEDELFGHVRGAFTDAKADKAGVFEQADGGSLFLDEIGDMEPPLQARLLRVLEDGRVRRVGGHRERIVDVRVIAATHCDLAAAIGDGSFREDLYFRLAGLPIEVPPLRDRGGDVELLFRHFVEHYCDRHQVPRRTIAPGVLARLADYPWPGNVRELKNLAVRLVLLGSDPVTVDQLPPGFRDTPRLPRGGAGALVPLREFRRRVEKEYIETVLEHTGWNVAAAARLLGLQRTSLHQKLAALGCRRPRPVE